MRQNLLRLLTASSLLLSACSIIQPKDSQPARELPDNPLAVAEQLFGEERWGEAVDLLERAIAQGLGTDVYLAALSKAAQSKQDHEGRLQAQLLLEETRTLQKQLPILSRLAHSDPFDQRVAEKLLSVRSGLILNRKPLSECGWRQADQHPGLAVQCLELALAIETNKDDRRLYDRLTAKKAESIKQAVEKQQIIREKRWKDRNQDRLQQARGHFRNGRFSEARTQLNLLLREDPDNAEAKQLLSTVKVRLEAYLESLLKTGDRMYREGEIEGAKAIWQAALNLDPHDARAKEKIERAERVLKNLESLRQTN